MRPAGVHGDVAGDGAGELARRIGGVEEAVDRGGVGDGDVGDARLDAGDAIGLVDVQHAGHAGDAEHDGVFERQGAAAERRPGAARHHLDLVVVAVAEDLAHLLGAFGQHHGKRQAAIGGERVGLEGAAPLLVGNEGRLRDELLELPDDLVPAGEDRAIGLGKGQKRHCGSKDLVGSASNRAFSRFTSR